jgi:hypothetical protein
MGCGLLLRGCEQLPEKHLTGKIEYAILLVYDTEPAGSTLHSNIKTIS